MHWNIINVIIISCNFQSSFGIPSREYWIHHKRLFLGLGKHSRWSSSVPQHKGRHREFCSFYLSILLQAGPCFYLLRLLHELIHSPVQTIFIQNFIFSFITWRISEWNDKIVAKLTAATPAAVVATCLMTLGWPGLGLVRGAEDGRLSYIKNRTSINK